MRTPIQGFEDKYTISPNIAQGNIANVIAGRTKTCGGFKWELA